MFYIIQQHGRGFDNEEQAVQFCEQIMERKIEKRKNEEWRKSRPYLDIIEISPIQKRTLKKLGKNRFSQTLYKKLKLRDGSIETVQCTYQITYENF